ncbi:DNRLRE domain-containing protein, partial [bacterium]
MDIDNTLVDSTEKSYAFENKANSFKVRFAGKSEDKKLGQIQQKDIFIKWYLSDGKEVAGDTAKNTITYSEIKEKTDLRYVVEGSTLKEDIILKSPEAPTEFKFVLNMKGLKYEAREDGSIEFLDPRNDSVVWVMPKPYMYDAQGEQSEAVTATLENKWGKLVLTIKADEEWISAADRVLPIVIDPTLQPGPRNGRDTFISSSYNDKNFRAKELLYVGKTEAYGATKSLFHFNVTPDEDDMTITSATFSVLAKQGTLSSIDLYPVKFDWKWDEYYLTWDRWQSSGKIGGLIDNATGPASGWWDFDVKKLVQEWVDNPTANYGLALYPAGGAGYKEFYSCD